MMKLPRLETTNACRAARGDTLVPDDAGAAPRPVIENERLAAACGYRSAKQAWRTTGERRHDLDRMRGAAPAHHKARRRTDPEH
jgi:hypothetical protein